MVRCGVYFRKTNIKDTDTPITVQKDQEHLLVRQRRNKRASAQGICNRLARVQATFTSICIASFENGLVRKNRHGPTTETWRPFVYENLSS